MADKKRSEERREAQDELAEVPAEEETHPGVPYRLVKRLVTVALVAGLAGGAAGGYLTIRFLPAVLPSGRLTVQEDSAVIEVVKKVSPSVVSITTETRGFSLFGIQRVQTGAGTGIIVSADGLILTNKHVVPEGATPRVFTADGKEYQAKVVSRDPLNDIAFVRISANGLTPAEIGDSAAMEVGQRVVAIGNALGRFQNTATVGIVSGLGRPIVASGEGEDTESLTNLIQTDAAINPGNSGGPLVNMSGQVIGINTAIAGGAENIGFALPINEVKSAIDSVKSEGRIVRPYLGVRYIPVTKEFATANGLKANYGAYITGGDDSGIVPGSPAEKAGLKDEDIILEVVGTKIDDKNTLTALIGRHKVGEKVKLKVLRGEKELELEATLEEAR